MVFDYLSLVRFFLFSSRSLTSRHWRNMIMCCESVLCCTLEPVAGNRTSDTIVTPFVTHITRHSKGQTVTEPAISRNPMPTSETRVGRVGTSSRVTAVTSSTTQHESHAESSSSRTPELSNTRTLHQTPEDSKPSTSSQRIGDGHDHMRTEATPIPSHVGTSLEDEG
eukprot:scpid106464/ scgid13691/ 